MSVATLIHSWSAFLISSFRGHFHQLRWQIFCFSLSDVSLRMFCWTSCEFLQMFHFVFLQPHAKTKHQHILKFIFVWQQFMKLTVFKCIHSFNNKTAKRGWFEYVINTPKRYDIFSIQTIYKLLHKLIFDFDNQPQKHRYQNQ